MTWLTGPPWVGVSERAATQRAGIATARRRTMRQRVGLAATPEAAVPAEGPRVAASETAEPPEREGARAAAQVAQRVVAQAARVAGPVARWRAPTRSRTTT